MFVARIKRRMIQGKIECVARQNFSAKRAKSRAVKLKIFRLFLTICWLFPKICRHFLKICQLTSGKPPHVKHAYATRQTRTCPLIHVSRLVFLFSCPQNTSINYLNFYFMKQIGYIFTACKEQQSRHWTSSRVVLFCSLHAVTSSDLFVKYSI